MARETTNLDDLLLKWFKVDEFNYDSSWIKEVKYLKKVLKFIPFLKQIGVCNSVSMGVADRDSDIDLFVVTKANRVYLVRFWMVVLFQLLGKRRYGNKVKKRFCLSFFVDENHIDMNDLMIDKDYYFEFWLKNIWWLFDDNDFIIGWNKLNGLNFSLSLFSWNYNSGFNGGRFLDVLNNIFGLFQRLKAHKSYKQKNFPKGVLFEEGIIKCHDQDIRWDFRKFISSSLK